MRLPQDVIDILLVAFILYRVLLFLKGTRALQVLFGLFFIAVAYGAGRYFELVTLNWMLDSFVSSLLIVVVILFQNDIRRALAHMGAHPLRRYSTGISANAEIIDEVVNAAQILSRQRVGALMLIERDTRLRNHVEVGTFVDAVVSVELLRSLFAPSTALHDGAVVIGDGRVVWAGCVLPLTTRMDMDKGLGTRHRAAAGVTEETDAVAVVVSEETGALSVGINGKLTRNLDAEKLAHVLHRIFPPPGTPTASATRRRHRRPRPNFLSLGGSP
jgi:uncharacterized protein (TIGR00159 family)